MFEPFDSLLAIASRGRGTWILFWLSGALSGCSGWIKEPPRTLLVPPLSPAVAAPSPVVPPKKDDPRQIRVFPPHLDPDSELSRHRSVFFAFDQSVIRSADQPVVEMHGIYLWRYPELRVRVEGHTDDRGGREYNLALGQRRAEAVKDAMRLLGARGEQIETVSFGEEKAGNLSKDEESRSRNRRADIVYLRVSR
ncbi:OmpA family protein [Roseateles sp.]|uniref:OmpA family protein n=1 Tax=Roseateles sp. TaxID=1971397 RepID=UPI002DFB025E|nr:OmpA family protein [Roseateles sp.]